MFQLPLRLQPFGDGEKKPTGRRLQFALRASMRGQIAPWPDRAVHVAIADCCLMFPGAPGSPAAETRTTPYAKVANTYSNSNYILQNQGHSRNRNHHEFNNSPNIRPDQIELKDIR